MGGGWRVRGAGAGAVVFPELAAELATFWARPDAAARKESVNPHQDASKRRVEKQRGVGME
jgi:hypothetical protein